MVTHGITLLYSRPLPRGSKCIKISRNARQSHPPSGGLGRGLPFVDDAKIECKIGEIMDIKRAFPTFLHYSLIFSDILRFSLLRAKKAPEPARF
jgi:hypothetical protein